MRRFYAIFSVKRGMVLRVIQLALTTALFLVFFGAVGSARRLPRGFTPQLFCSACRVVSREVHDAYVSVPASETIDAGSFRLAESGKQPERRQVPLRSSELHAVTVLDAACARISSNYVVFDVNLEIFVSIKEQQRHGLKENATADCSHVRALRAICTNIIDEFEDELKERLKSGVVNAAGWTGKADEFCGETGLLVACNSQSDPGIEGDVVQLALQQKKLHDEFLALNAIEHSGNESNTTSKTLSERNMSDSTENVQDSDVPTGIHQREDHVATADAAHSPTLGDTRTSSLEVSHSVDEL